MSYRPTADDVEFRFVRVMPGERTCLECGEVTTGKHCIRCGEIEDGKKREGARLVETLSYLRPGEYRIIS